MNSPDMTKDSANRRAAFRMALLSTIFGVSLTGVAHAALDEVVVTAQKREASLQDTPISMAAFSGDDLDKRGAANISDVGDFTPNIQFDSSVALSGSSNSASIYIRGIGQPDFIASADPGVGVYLDGVYISSSMGGVLDLLDVERVEVLRGPQGTLFGRNTIGGAISVVTKKPDNEFSGSAELTLGEFERINAKASINVPIVEDVLAARIGVSTKNSDGYADRILTGETMGGEDTDALRGMLRFTPNEDWDINFAFDYTKSKDDSPQSSLVGVSAVPGPPPPAGTWAGAYNAIYGIANMAVYDESFVLGDNEKSMATGPTGVDMDLWGASLNMEWDLGFATVRSITAYRTWEAEFGRDPDHSPIVIIQQAYEHEQDQFSQEFNIFGSAFDDRLDWLLGAYYFDEHAEEFTDVPVVPDLFTCCGLPISGGGTQVMDNENYAFFGQGTYQITDQLGVTLGLRYSHEEKNMINGSRKPQLPGMPYLLTNRNASATFNSLTPRISVEYKPLDNMLLYASYSEGYKGGGFVARYLFPRAEPLAFDSEEAQTYEVGFKGDFFDDRLRLNGAAFFSEYENIQISVFNFGVPEIRNAAEGEIKGLELEATAVPTDNLTLNAGFGYIDAEYTKIDPGDLVGVLVPFDTSAAFQNTPEYSWNVGIEYLLPFANLGDLRLRTDYSYKTEIANDAVNTPQLIQDDFGLLSASANLELADSPWQFTVFGRNLTDEDYIISGTSDIASIGIIEAVWGRPREWGVTAKVNF